MQNYMAAVKWVCDDALDEHVWVSELTISLQEAKVLVNSIPLTTENWLRKLYIYSLNNNTSNEDKHETNHINNKYNDTNTHTRKLHNL